MRRHRVMLGLLCAAALWCAALPAVSGTARAGVTVAGIWHRAIEVPGAGALNPGGDANVTSVSCASAGNCLAGGYYRGRSGHYQAFVASERNGTWGTAIEVPGIGALTKGGFAEVSSVSCAPAGDCAAGGYYFGGAGPRGRATQAFVASERNGTWHRAFAVPGIRALNKRGNAGVSSVSCASAGNCLAGGYYADSTHHEQAFVASERNGTWRTAIEVPGTGALNTGGEAGGDAEVDSVSCGSAGDCAAGGYYADGSGHDQAFVASERDGTWGTAIEVPGTGALNTGGEAGVESVSCASAGNCGAGGYYSDGSYYYPRAFVASERNGTWHRAIEVPGTAALSKGYVFSVSCSSAGNCLAGGDYTGRSGHGQAFVAAERNGTWHRAIAVPGTGALNTGGSASVNSVSCASAGNCLAGGSYRRRSGHVQAFVASERNGTWHRAIEVPGTAELNTGGDASVTAVSCGSAGNCTAAGYYRRGSDDYQVFVASERNGTWGTAIEVPGTGR